MSEATDADGPLAAWFGREVSSRSLGLLRIATAMTMLFLLVSPWVSYRMDDHAGLLLGSWAVLGGGLLLLFGFKTRAASVVVAIGFAVVHLYYGFVFDDGGVARLRQPGYMFQVVALLALTPSGRSLSVDRVLEVRRARRERRPAEPERMPAWLLELFVIQAATIWLWAGYDMAEASWLSGARLELYFLDLFGDSDSFARRPGLHTVAVALAWFGLIASLAIAVGLLVRRTRPWAAALALLVLSQLLIHYSLSWTDSYIHMMMANTLLACVPPEPIHRGVTTVIKGAAAAEAERDAAPASRPTGLAYQPWFAALALGLVALALNIPPVRAQVLDQPPGLTVWDWRLRDPVRKVGICDLRFYDQQRGGERIERWRLLGYERPRDVPPADAKLRRGRIGEASKQVCAALREAGDEPPRVELWARCPAGREWEQVAERERDVCSGPTPGLKSQPKTKGGGQ